MKKSGKTYIIVLKIFLSVLFSFCFSTGFTQNPEQTLTFAEEQLNQGNYLPANKALNRLMFFDNGLEYPEIFELFAYSYFQLNDYNNAWYYYDLAAIRSDKDSLRAEFTFMKVACRLYLKEYHEAMIDLMSFQGHLTENQRWQFNLLAGINSFYLMDYIQSEIHFRNCADSNSYLMVKSAFSDIKKVEKRFNPNKAKVMSIILPGSGQLYAGDLKNGINSFALVFGFIAVGLSVSSSIRFIDAAIIIFPWFQRYYMGGYQKASVITLEKQNAEKNKVLLSLIDQLSETQIHW